MKLKSKPLTFSFKLHIVLLLFGLGSMTIMESFRNEETRYTLEAQQLDVKHAALLSAYRITIAKIHNNETIKR